MAENSKTWTVVKFTQENSVSAVPTSWIIDGSKCLWPPYAADKLTAAIKAHTIDTCWPSYKIEVFRNSTFPHYETARSKSITAEYTSDLNTSENDHGDEASQSNKKRRKIRSRLRYSSSESEVEMNTQKVNSPPRMPKKVLGNNFKEGKTSVNLQKKLSDASSTPVISHKEAANQDNNDTLLGNFKEARTPANLQKLRNASSTPTALSCQHLDVSIQDTHNIDSGNFQTINKAESCTCCPKHGKYNREILQNLFLLRSLVIDLKDDVRELKTRTQVDAGLDISKSIFSNFELPLNEVENLDTLNIFLKDEDNFKNATMEFSKIGGGSENDFVKRTITRIVSDELAKKYSWLGRKKKKPFNDLEVAKLIINAANMIGFANKPIEKALAGWLKRANERSQRNK